MKKYILALSIFNLMIFSSCLRYGLEDLPEFEGNDITTVQQVEYRFVGDRVSPASGQKIVEAVKLSQSPAAVIDKDNAMVKISVKVPATTNIFTQQHRDACNVNNIVVGLGISTAARIAPIDGAPLLGVPGDWSKPNKYVVTAANGNKKTWTIEVVSFTK